MFSYNGCANPAAKILQDTLMKKLFLTILSLGILAGCSSEPVKPAAAEKPKPKAPETITGTSALYKCYIAARGWAQDAQPYRIDSQASADSSGHDGKSVTWRSGFASPARSGAKAYTWSNGEVSPGVEDTYSPTNSSTLVFNIQFLKVDSDKAFEVAQRHGGDKQLEKERDTPVMYSLDWSRATNQLIWHVMYGSDRDSAKLRVAVDASTGDFLKVEK
jgi:hypothetical protein